MELELFARQLWRQLFAVFSAARALFAHASFLNAPELNVPHSGCRGSAVRRRALGGRTESVKFRTQSLKSRQHWWAYCGQRGALGWRNNRASSIDT
jgi:hypothetical protein